MARINLLPWRAEQRERKNKEFLTLVAVVALMAAVAAFATWFFFNAEYKEQQDANALITAENNKLDIALKEIEDLEKQKQEMISRMKVIQDLQGKRPLPVLVWDDLARSIPKSLYLTKLSKKGDVITIEGKADNPNIVSQFITALDNSKWMGESEVKNIKDKERTAKDDTQTMYPEDEYVEFKITTKIASTATLEEINKSTTKNNTEDQQAELAEATDSNLEKSEDSSSENSNSETVNPEQNGDAANGTTNNEAANNVIIAGAEENQDSDSQAAESDVAAAESTNESGGQ